ncbi:MAG: phenylalanine--tRNA ligase subunit beta [Chitinophagaceae bacterium]
MNFSYNWLSEFLPVQIEPVELSKILTSTGLEVEKMEKFEEVKGGLKGLVIGEVLETEQHPNADKLRLTVVDIGNGVPLRIVCGAPNVAQGQKVVVAAVGTTIYPVNGEPLTIKVAKIRGVESNGMICAEDEIGWGDSHSGIMVLNEDAAIGSSAEAYFKPYTDTVFDIGLTPNRMDAMSHWGAARDICAYLTHHGKKEYQPLIPATNIQTDNRSLTVEVTIENLVACKRYSGVCMTNITVQESPKWMQDKLKAIGLRTINNIVDTTNYIQHETGQPLHAFDLDAIKANKIVVKNLPEGTPFITLDEKERKLSADDLMICNAQEAMCIAGVFGGANSSVSEKTKSLFLESAYFDPASIRKTSFRHNLRTDAATRFEKGIDISNTVTVLKRAAALIKEICGGEIASDIIDVYPQPQTKTEVMLSYSYLKKLSGKEYAPEAVNNILKSLGFTILNHSKDAITVQVPYHKPDVFLPADIVEEILRIDGLDNIAIPGTITISPSVEPKSNTSMFREKAANFLVGQGFSEILTNSLTNSKYISEDESDGVIKLLNNLSKELDIMRSDMLPTALEVIAFNINRKNNNLKLFEFGKTYHTTGVGKYKEQTHLCLYITGEITKNSWKEKARVADIYFAKGIAEALLKLYVRDVSFDAGISDSFDLHVTINHTSLVLISEVKAPTLLKFDIKQPVYFIDINWDFLCKQAGNNKVQYEEVPRFPAVERDLAMIVAEDLKYEHIEQYIQQLLLKKLKEIKLFDVFKSDKLGKDKKSIAISFTFLDEEKTLTDKEIDKWMYEIITTLEKQAGAEIRK